MYNPYFMPSCCFTCEKHLKHSAVKAIGPYITEVFIIIMIQYYIFYKIQYLHFYSLFGHLSWPLATNIHTNSRATCTTGITLQKPKLFCFIIDSYNKFIFSAYCINGKQDA